MARRGGGQGLPGGGRFATWAPMFLPLLLAGAEPATLATRCPASSGPALFVDVTGFKNRAGQVRVRVFGGATKTWFDKKHWIARVQVPTPASGKVGFCMPVARPGTYAVDVRHDTDFDGETDRGDGGGVSGNPQVSLMDVLFGRKPDPMVVAVQVGQGATTVPITLKYLQGGSFKPWR